MDRDFNLTDRFIQGDVDAFSQVVALHQPRVTRLAYRLLGWQGEVDDVVQETFLRALRHRRRFRGRSDLTTWLTAIAVNVCRTERRRRRLSLRRLFHPPPQAQGACDELERDETMGRIRNAVQALPINEREVIVLYYLESLPVEGIGEILGCSPNAVNIRLHRARTTLKHRLADLAEVRP